MMMRSCNNQNPVVIIITIIFFKLKNGTVRILQVTCDLSKFPLSNDQIHGLAKFLPNLREEWIILIVWINSFGKRVFRN